MAFIEHAGQPGQSDRQLEPELDAQLAADLGLCRPWVHGPSVGYCPGVTEYGHGQTLTAVHGRTCCDRWDTARAARLAERQAEQEMEAG